ncbi:MAG: HD family phosphohydrolase [Mangrovibacterium sp.]
MKRFLARLRRYYHISYVFSALLASVVILYLIIPGESRFQYEFQKNTPWQHENLVAPFDFAIYKDEAVIKAQKDSIRSDFAPYYRKDSVVASVQCANFKKSLEKQASVHTDLTETMINELTSKLNALYEDGIIAQSLDNNPILRDRKSIQVISDKSVTITSIDSILPLKKAFTILDGAMQQQLGNSYYDVSQHVSAANFLQENLTYEADYSEQELKRLTSSISETQGMIQAGERIILKGDIVNPYLFRVLTSLKRTYESRQTLNVDHFLLIVGKIMVILICFLMLVLYFVYFRPQIFNEKRHLSFILFSIVVMVFAYSFILRFDYINIYIVPIVILPILIRIFFDSRTAIFTHMISSLLIGYFAPNNYEFIFMSFVAGVVAVFSLDKLHRRSDIVFAAVWVLLSYIVMYIAFSMIHEGNYQSIEWEHLQWFVANAILVLLVYPLIYVFEKLFGFVSDVTLIELSNTNQPLLRKLAEEAPGTFQHSLQLANLSETLAREIGANPFLAYTGALYHDIGKICHPIYFVENQSEGVSPHNKMNYKDSAKIIISHVEDGVKLAKKYGLPPVLRDFITTHHGTTQAKYFYTMYKNEHPDEEIDMNCFTYHGPRPKTKETAILMLVDGIEAATRALKEKTHDNISSLIDKMIDAKLKDNQLDLTPLTLRDLTIVKETLTEKILNIYHVRIEYPEEKKEN